MSSEAQWTVRGVEAADEGAWRELYRGYRSFYERPEDEDAVDRVWGWLNDADHECVGYVVVDGTGRVGALANVRRFARPSTGSTGLFLDDLFTDPDLRGRGLGRTMLRFLRNHAAEHRLSVVRWTTAEGNATARALYDSEATATAWVTYDMTPQFGG